MLLIGQKLRFGISKHCCPFLHFLMAFSEICWIVLRPTSRPLQKETLLAINLTNIHKTILGQMFRACSLILQLIPVSFAVLRNCYLWVRYVWERQSANACHKLNTMNLSEPRNRVNFNMNFIKFRVRIRFGAWEYNGIYSIFWLTCFSDILVNIKLNCSMWVYIWIYQSWPASTDTGFTSRG